MSRLKADINDLQKAASTFNSVTADIDALAKKIDSIAAELTNSWEGDASMEYITRLKAQSKKLKAIKSPLKEVAKQCNSSAKDLQFFDNLINGLIKGLYAIIGIRGGW